MANRRRNINLHLMFTKDEKELIKKVSTIKGVTITDLIMELVKKDYEKLLQK